MEYFDAPEANPGQDGICSDNECPCGYPGATIPRGTGYLYISKELVEFRRDARTVEQARKKLDRIRASTPGMMVMFDPSVSMPILMCEQGARKRGLNMEVAAADARYWWEHHKAPLRPTPLARDIAVAPAVRKVSTAADAMKETNLSRTPVPPVWTSPVSPQPAWPPPITTKTARPNNAWVWWLVGSLGFLSLLGMATVLIFTVSKSNSENPSIFAGTAGKTLTVGSDFTWPPFEYIDDEGEYAGFDVELMRMIAEKIDAEITWENTPWDSLFAKVMDGQVDLAISAIGYSEERDENMDFSKPYLENPDIFLARNDFTGGISAPEDLSPYQISVLLGSMQDEWLETELVPQSILSGGQIKHYDSHALAITDLVNGQSDIVILEKTLAVRYLAQYPDLQIVYTRENPRGGLYIVYPSGSYELRQSIDQAILELKISGEIDRLFEEVFVNYP